MRILSLDLSKYKTVACDYEAESGRHRFATVLTTPKALHDLIVDREPQRVVIEICSIAGWVGDLVRSLRYRPSDASDHVRGEKPIFA
jgi:transposase